MVNELDYLKESASQTAGPYVHIGLAPHQAGFDIFETNFSNVIAGPQTKGERITIEVEAQRLGGKSQPVIHLLDAAGNGGREIGLALPARIIVP